MRLGFFLFEGESDRHVSGETVRSHDSGFLGSRGIKADVHEDLIIISILSIVTKSVEKEI